MSVVAVVIAEKEEESRHGSVLTDDGVDGGHDDCPPWCSNVPATGRP
jgi:hypothetical protein